MASAVPLSSLSTGGSFQTSGATPGVGFAPSRLVFVYRRGTTTQVPVYSDAALTVPTPQPLATGSNGGASPGSVPGYIAGDISIDFVDQASGARTEAEPLVAADVIGTDGKVGGPGSIGLTGSVVNGVQQTIAFGRSGSLFVTTGQGRYTIPFAGAIVSVIASVGTAPTGASVICDVKKNGTTVFTTQANRPTIAASANVSGTAVPDVTALALGDYLTVDVAQVGATIAGADLNVQILWKSS